MRNPESITPNNSMRNRVAKLLVIAAPLLGACDERAEITTLPQPDNSTTATATVSATADKAPKSVDIEKTHKNGIPEEVLEEARRTGKFYSSDLFSPKGSWTLKGSWQKELKSLEQLRGMQLTEVEVHGKGISDISPLKGMPLKHVALWHTSITDFSALEGAPITHLSLFGCKEITDFSPLKNMKGLVDLSLKNTSITDISALKGMSSLRSLSTKGTSVRDHSPIKDLNLREAQLSADVGDDLSFLKKQIDEGAEVYVGPHLCPIDKNYQVKCAHMQD